MRRRVLLVGGAMLLAATAGAVATIAVDGVGQPAAAPRPPRVETATIVRTDLTSTVLAEGSLRNAPTDPVINALSGTYTWLPRPGSTIEAGGTLYDVDAAPVVLFSGTTPAWRPFGLGMSNGPDVEELDANLVALGDATGLFSMPSDAFTSLTALAVERWQSRAGLQVDGTIPLGRVVFVPGAVVVGAENVYPGQPATPGDLPYAVTSTTRTVTVPLGPDVPPVHVGETVGIVLPTRTRTPGTITAVGPAPPDARGQGSSSSSGGGPVATVTPSDPAATGASTGVAVQVAVVTASVRRVLAAPVSSLLALARGGYGVEVVEPSGARRLVAVRTGLFSGTRVQVAGHGIRPGTKVVVAQ